MNEQELDRLAQANRPRRNLQNVNLEYEYDLRDELIAAIRQLREQLIQAWQEAGIQQARLDEARAAAQGLRKALESIVARHPDPADDASHPAVAIARQALLFIALRHD